MKKFVFALLLLTMGFYGCVEPPDGNETINETVETAYYGDTATVDYILWVDEAVIDTSMADVAQTEGIYTPFRDYEPLEVPLLLGGQFIDGFVSGIIGMEVGETRTVEVAPADAYGEYDDSLVHTLPRYYSKNGLEEVPISYFEERNITVENGTTFNTDIGTVFIEDFNETSATIFYYFRAGDEFEYNGFTHVVAASYPSNLTYLIRIDAEENETYYTASPLTGQPVNAKAIEVTNGTITLDENGPLAGKTLVYDITLVDLVKATT